MEFSFRESCLQRAAKLAILPKSISRYIRNSYFVNSFGQNGRAPSKNYFWSKFQTGNRDFVVFRKPYA